MESGSQPASSLAKCVELRNAVRRQCVEGRLREQALDCRKRFDEEEQASFSKLNSQLSVATLVPNMLAVHRYSSDAKYSFRMLAHSSLFVHVLMNNLGDGDITRLLLDVLVNLSAYEQFEMDEDAEVCSMFQELLKLRPKETLVLLSNISANQTQFSYSEMFASLIDSGCCLVLKELAINSELTVWAVRFLCGVSLTRPMLPLRCLETVFQTIVSFPSESDDCNQQISHMLGEWTKLTQLPDLAALLLRYFLPISLKLYDDYTLEMLMFYNYISMHEQYLQALAHAAQSKLQATSLEGRYTTEALVILFKICEARHTSPAEMYGENFVEQLIPLYYTQEQQCQNTIRYALSLTASDKADYKLYRREAFQDFCMRSLTSLGIFLANEERSEVASTLELLKLIAINAQSDEVACRIVHPFASEITSLANSPLSTFSNIHQLCDQLLEYTDIEQHP